MIILEQKDFRDMVLPSDNRILTITDPPYNINFKYDVCKDNLSESDYINLLSRIPKPCVIIHYPEETFKYVFKALGMPDKVLFWCYHSHLKRAVRMISFYGVTPDLSRYLIPFRNPNDKRIKQKIASGVKGTAIKEWFIVEQVKNVSKEHQGYVNQIPEEVIKIILSVAGRDFDTVYDPFVGSGTTLKVAKDMGFKCIGCDIAERAIIISKKRLGVSI